MTPDGAFFGHPRGLAVLCCAEAWVAFSFYGMQSLLVLYMTERLLQPGLVGGVWGLGPVRDTLALLFGPLAGAAFASAIMGLFAAVYYATPILGGLLADRWLGRTRSVVLGCLFMVLGYLLLAIPATFLPALGCILVGSGLAGSLKAQVGALYGPADSRRGDAFQIYNLAVSIAVVLSPLVCGTLGQDYAWRWGFVAAAIGMAIGLVVYLALSGWLPSDSPSSGPAQERDDRPPAALSPADWRILAMLFALLPVLAVLSIGNMEIFNGYLLWGQRHYALVVDGETMPVSWLLSLDAFISIGTLLLSIAFWRWLARRGRRPSELAKMAAGGLLLAAAPLVLVVASVLAHGHKIGLGWALAFHVVNDIGFSNVYPISLALYVRLAPKSLSATVVNACVLQLFLANLLVARLAGLLGRMSGADFWLLHAGLIAAAALLLVGFAIAFRPMLRRAPINPSTVVA